MKQVFLKKYWEEENVIFYMHFKNGEAIRQVEIRPAAKLFLSLSNPMNGDSILYDQSLEELDLKESDLITEDEFNKIWDTQ
jgi:hypothetical protein